MASPARSLDIKEAGKEWFEASGARAKRRVRLREEVMGKTEWMKKVSACLRFLRLCPRRAIHSLIAPVFRFRRPSSTAPQFNHQENRGMINFCVPFASILFVSASLKGGMTRVAPRDGFEQNLEGEARPAAPSGHFAVDRLFAKSLVFRAQKGSATQPAVSRSETVCRAQRPVCGPQLSSSARARRGNAAMALARVVDATASKEIPRRAEAAAAVSSRSTGSV